MNPGEGDTSFLGRVRKKYELYALCFHIVNRGGRQHFHFLRCLLDDGLMRRRDMHKRQYRTDEENADEHDAFQCVESLAPQEQTIERIEQGQRYSPLEDVYEE